MGIPLLVLLLYSVIRYERESSRRSADLAAMNREALTDAITGLGNQRAFHSDLAKELARASPRAYPLTVAVIDIDDFKVINDSYGHARGDSVLRQIAELMSNIRSEDRGYRVGGDEFAFIMPDTDLQSVSEVMDRFRTLVAETANAVTISIGLSGSTRGFASAPQTCTAQPTQHSTRRSARARIGSPLTR